MQREVGAELVKSKIYKIDTKYPHDQLTVRPGTKLVNLLSNYLTKSIRVKRYAKRVNYIGRTLRVPAPWLAWRGVAWRGWRGVPPQRRGAACPPDTGQPAGRKNQPLIIFSYKQHNHLLFPSQAQSGPTGPTRGTRVYRVYVFMIACRGYSSDHCRGRNDGVTCLPKHGIFSNEHGYLAAEGRG